MADTTKLADTFPALRIVVTVSPQNLYVTLEHCNNLGLLPNVCGYEPRGNLILFQVLVPDLSSGAEERFSAEINQFGARIWKVTKTKLICPVF